METTIRKDKEPAATLFRDWSLQRLEDTFGLKDNPADATMREWLAVSTKFDQPVADELESLRHALDRHSRGWNEEEMKLFFIGPLFRLVDFDGPNYGAFGGRTLSAKVGDYALSGVVDGLIARGRYEPVIPYFCLSEYKPEKGREPDPAGQVLAAMLVARELNQDRQVIYGAYVIGRLWFFLTLDGVENVYTISRSFDASSEAIAEIFAVLSKLKTWVQARINR
jgi:hypothetical protein